MSKHDLNMTVTIAGVEAEHTVTIYYDYSTKHKEVEIYDVVLSPNGAGVNEYLDKLITEAQYDAIEGEILRAHFQ